MSTFLDEPPPPPEELLPLSPPPHAATTAATATAHAASIALRLRPLRHLLLFKESSPPRRPAFRAPPGAPGCPMVPDQAALRAPSLRLRARPAPERAPSARPGPTTSSPRNARAALRRCGRWSP